MPCRRSPCWRREYLSDPASACLPGRCEYSSTPSLVRPAAGRRARAAVHDLRHAAHLRRHRVRPGRRCVSTLVPRFHPPTFPPAVSTLVSPRPERSVRPGRMHACAAPRAVSTIVTPLPPAFPRHEYSSTSHSSARCAVDGVRQPRTNARGNVGGGRTRGYYSTHGRGRRAGASGGTTVLTAGGGGRVEEGD